MNYKIQLISFICSFIFGIFFYLTSLLNYKIIKNRVVFMQYLISFVYIIDMVLLYILMMYKVNYGVIHIYFVIMMFLGFMFGCIYCKKVRKICKLSTKKLHR